MLEHAEIEHHDDADEDLEQENELALRHQIRLAGLVDQFRDFAHRRVHRQIFRLREHHQAEEQPEDADTESTGE